MRDDLFLVTSSLEVECIQKIMQIQYSHIRYLPCNIHQHIYDIHPLPSDTALFEVPWHKTGLQLTQLTGRIPSRSNLSGNMHVAFVKKSTPAKMKKRGHVPPRLDTVLRRVRYVPPITGSAICE